ncbi:MAG: hypothetical protein GY699_20515, partial [Desulfobacteraceae bacterium]|nr:hypothetical protein [Desulfobacteraceae bacterium]
GFGFSFLEAWTAGKCLWGRILPDICTDFIDKGIQLNHLYESLSVPLDWIGKDRFYHKWRRCLFKTCHDFNLTPDSDRVDQAFDTLTHNNRIDFGMLDETFQKQVLLKLFSEDRAKQLLLDINPFLNGPGQLKDNHDFIGRNQKAILSGYNKAVYENRLLSLYKKVVKKPVNHKIDKGKLLQSFLNPLHFCLLKFSDYES